MLFLFARLFSCMTAHVSRAMHMLSFPIGYTSLGGVCTAHRPMVRAMVWHGWPN